MSLWFNLAFHGIDNRIDSESPCMSARWKGYSVFKAREHITQDVDETQVSNDHGANDFEAFPAHAHH